MANIKSQIKRIKTNEKARLRNKSVKSSLKTAVRKYREAAAAGEPVAEPRLPPREHGVAALTPVDTVATWTGGREHAAPVYERTALRAGDRIPGPALVREANATTVVEPGWTAEATSRDHLLLRRTEPLCRAAAAGRTESRPR